MESNGSVTKNGSTTVMMTWPYEQYMYIGFASAALIANLLIAIVLLRNKIYLKSAAFMVGLMLGDFALAIGTAMAGALRSKYINLHIENAPVQPFSCLLKFTTLLVVGVQLPSVIIFLIGVERITAVAFFQWYYKQWSNRKEWFLTLIGYIYCLISLAVCWWIVGNLQEDITTSIMCGTPFVVRPTYNSYHFGLGVACGCFSLLATVVSLLTLRKKRKKFQNNNANTSISNTIVNKNSRDVTNFVKKQCKLTQSAICLALCDFALVVIPNVMLSLLSYFPTLPSVGSAATCMLCLRSTVTILIYLRYNREFRINFMKTFKWNYRSNVVNQSTLLASTTKL